MKVAKVFAGLALVLSAASFVSADVKTFKIDPVHTTVNYRVLHAGVSPSYGRIDDPTGTFTIDSEDPTKSTLEVSLDAAKINSANPKRDDHLRGPDFFNVKQFPTITFKSTSVKTAGENKWDVTGDFTLHGVTKPITISLTKIGEADLGAQFGYRAGFDGTVTIKRSEFGMTNMIPMLGDEVTIVIGLEGVRE